MITESANSMHTTIKGREATLIFDTNSNRNVARLIKESLIDELLKRAGSQVIIDDSGESLGCPAANLTEKR